MEDMAFIKRKSKNSNSFPRPKQRKVAKRTAGPTSLYRAIHVLILEPEADTKPTTPLNPRIGTKSDSKSIQRSQFPPKIFLAPRSEMEDLAFGDHIRAPLLSEGGREGEVVVGIDGDADDDRWSESGGAVTTVVEEENPFEFLGAPSFSLPPPSPIDPFRNHSPRMGVYGWFKLVVCLPIALARLVLFGLALALGYLATKLALTGWKDRQMPMPRWRCRLMWVTRICARCILFSFGYHWINRIGRPASREVAPIVVSNHVSYVEPIFFFYELFPTIVASESHDSLPFVGTIIRAMQVIYVDRFSPSSRKNAVNEIKRKASSNSFPHLLLFPEGTTTNGRFLISFQHGAFIPSLPIQPVVVRYPFVHFDQSWGHISLAKLMFKMFTQFQNFMEVEYLPVIFPYEEETASHLSKRTSYVMGKALNVIQTSHAYGDLMLLTKASDFTKDECSNFLVEMAWVESSFSISTSEALELMDQFCLMNPDSNGLVKFRGFCTVFGLGDNLPSKKIFTYLDVERRGSIAFRQFLIGSAHVRKQPLFMRACETAFNTFCDSESSCSTLTIEQFRDKLQSMMPSTDKESLNQLVHLFDVDEDGKIDRDDFMSCLWKNPLLVALFPALIDTTILAVHA
ncbi:lysophospholipid acyltransferase LPEAT2 [Phalaenopsis equestris]|uniref:lysophospholipid acyltransferase LPEAT2 n=1 Tax=Phalaenopsis equestris TaxID=78828 RepID=UPI0009E52F59|nr:lysophospholipid acyltransferase LPEAT2 [Phalaenopsis equestris]